MKTIKRILYYMFVTFDHMAHLESYRKVSEKNYDMYKEPKWLSKLKK